MPESTTFEYTITVMPEHLDGQHHVNNVVYVQFMQDAAGKHWDSVQVISDDPVLWVVRKHEVEFLAPAFLNDLLLIRTWTAKHSAVTWDRHYQIIRLKDQKKIIEAKSVWVLLDALTGKPRRIDAAILQRFSR